jgi:hypothetical protein
MRSTLTPAPVLTLLALAPVFARRATLHAWRIAEESNEG